jgi:hypothetical protein
LDRSQTYREPLHNWPAIGVAFYSTDLDKVLKDKGITTIIMTGWKVSGSVLYTSVGATLRGYTVVIPLDAALGPSDYEEAIGQYQILNQNAANAKNEPLKEKTSRLSRTDMISFQRVTTAGVRHAWSGPGHVTTCRAGRRRSGRRASARC